MPGFECTRRRINRKQAVPVECKQETAVPVECKQVLVNIEPPSNITILGYLGAGSYGDVYKARINSTQYGQHVVVADKHQHKSGPSAKKTTDQIREIEIMRAISHPCLVPLLGWRETAFDIQMIMPLYDTDLHNYINNTTV